MILTDYFSKNRLIYLDNKIIKLTLIKEAIQ